ncbi:MmyB family transcriptional regulator [Streptomyces sp. NPDC002746]
MGTDSSHYRTIRLRYAPGTPCHLFDVRDGVGIIRPKTPLLKWRTARPSLCDTGIVIYALCSPSGTAANAMTDNRPPGAGAITHVLRNARTRAVVSAMPEDRVPRRKKAGLTQREVAQRIGSTDPRWYRDLELGKPRNYSAAFLNSVRRVLQLNETEWEVVWRHTQGFAPAAPVAETPPLVPRAVHALVEGQRWPAILTSQRWDLLAHNAAAARVYPWARMGANVMEWALLGQAARTQLVNWDTEWAPALIGILRLRSEQWPGDKTIGSLVEAARSDPSTRKVWDSNISSPFFPCAGHEPRRIYASRGQLQFAVTHFRLSMTDAQSYTYSVFTPSHDASE